MGMFTGGVEVSEIEWIEMRKQWAIEAQKDRIALSKDKNYKPDCYTRKETDALFKREVIND